MQRALIVVLVGWLFAVLSPSIAQQDPSRLALLIGNKAYTAKLGPLANPHIDVDLVEASLKQLGFRVTVLKDATYKQMDTALKRYVTDVRRAGKGALSFFYYSGHGVANPENQVNYLIPVDVPDADDDKVWFESLQQNVVIDLLSKQAPTATHYLVFDSCRNELKLAGSNAKSLGADKGFVSLPDTAGLLIAYATAPKQTASDGGKGGGPYAKILAEELLKPGVESVSMFRNVQIRVKQSIGQDPWLSFPSLPPVYLAGQSANPTGTAPVQPAAPNTAASEWQDVKDTINIAALEHYVQRHRNDPIYAALARDRLDMVKRREQAALAKAAADAAAKKNADDDARSKVEADRRRLEQDEQWRKAADAAASKKLEASATTSAPSNLQCGNDAGGYNRWLSQYKLIAANQGISQQAIDAAMTGIRYDTVVIGHSREQKTFNSTFEQFYAQKVPTSLINKARKIIQEHDRLLEQIEQKFGVPPAILVAVWGLESRFEVGAGQKFPLAQALSTLAYDCRKADFYGAQLADALRIIDRGYLPASKLLADWDGTIGPLRFLPASYLRHAVDFDGDGRRDLIHSIPDMLASLANFLKTSGWRRGDGWSEGTPNNGVIRQWNRAGIYVQTIVKMSEALARR